MVDLTNGKKRTLEEGAKDKPGPKKAKTKDMGVWKSLWKLHNKSPCCWKFATTGKCTKGENCAFDHVTIDGQLIQKSKFERGDVYQRKYTKREIGVPLYTGILRWRKDDRESSWISIPQDITFKGLRAKEEIYVLKKDIFPSCREAANKKDLEVTFKVYIGVMGIGAMIVKAKDRPAKVSNKKKKIKG